MNVQELKQKVLNGGLLDRSEAQWLCTCLLYTSPSPRDS